MYVTHTVSATKNSSYPPYVQLGGENACHAAVISLPKLIAYTYAREAHGVH